MPATAIITKSNFANQQEVVVEVDIDPAMTPYALVPTAYEPNDLGSFTVTTFSANPIALEEFEEADQWERATIQGSWSGDCAGGSLLSPTWRKNTQYLVQMDQPCEFLYIVSQLVRVVHSARLSMSWQVCAIPKVEHNISESEIGFYVVDAENHAPRR